MSIAIVMPLAHQRGGAEQLLLNFLRANDRTDFPCTLVFLEHGPMVETAQCLGYPAEVILAGRLRQASKFAQTVWALARLLRRVQARAILSWMAKAHFYAAPAARAAGVPSLWWQHGIPGSWMDRWVTRLPAAGILCCSEAAARAQAALPPSRPLRVVYPCVDLSRFDPTALPSPIEARRMLGLPTDRIHVGAVARLQRWKGIDVLLRAAARVIANRRDFHFTVVGGEHALEPGYQDELAALVEELDLSDSVTFAGYQANPELWMQAMDIIVHAPRGPEPFGMVIIEGMALGKLVIAAKAGGAAEIISDGVNGFYVAPGDATMLADTISAVARHPDAPRVRHAARERAMQFSHDSFARLLTERITELVPNARENKDGYAL